MLIAAALLVWFALAFVFGSALGRLLKHASPPAPGPLGCKLAGPGSCCTQRCARDAA